MSKGKENKVHPAMAYKRDYSNKPFVFRSKINNPDIEVKSYSTKSKNNNINRVHNRNATSTQNSYLTNIVMNQDGHTHNNRNRNNTINKNLNKIVIGRRTGKPLLIPQSNNNYGIILNPIEQLKKAYKEQNPLSDSEVESKSGSVLSSSAMESSIFSSILETKMRNNTEKSANNRKGKNNNKIKDSGSVYSDLESLDYSKRKEKEDNNSILSDFDDIKDKDRAASSSVFTADDKIKNRIKDNKKNNETRVDKVEQVKKSNIEKEEVDDITKIKEAKANKLNDIGKNVEKIEIVNKKEIVDKEDKVKKTTIKELKLENTEIVDIAKEDKENKEDQENGLKLVSKNINSEEIFSDLSNESKFSNPLDVKAKFDNYIIQAQDSDPLVYDSNVYYNEIVKNKTKEQEQENKIKKTSIKVETNETEVKEVIEKNKSDDIIEKNDGIKEDLNEDFSSNYSNSRFKVKAKDIKKNNKKSIARNIKTEKNYKINNDIENKKEEESLVQDSHLLSDTFREDLDKSVFQQHKNNVLGLSSIKKMDRENNNKNFHQVNFLSNKKNFANIIEKDDEISENNDDREDKEDAKDNTKGISKSPHKSLKDQKLLKKNNNIKEAEVSNSINKDIDTIPEQINEDNYIDFNNENDYNDEQNESEENKKIEVVEEKAELLESSEKSKDKEKAKNKKKSDEKNIKNKKSEEKPQAIIKEKNVKEKNTKKEKEKIQNNINQENERIRNKRSSNIDSISKLVEDNGIEFDLILNQKQDIILMGILKSKINQKRLLSEVEEKEYNKEQKDNLRLNKQLRIVGIPPPETETFGNGRYSLRNRIPAGFLMPYNRLQYTHNKYGTFEISGVTSSLYDIIESEEENKESKPTRKIKKKSIKKKMTDKYIGKEKNYLDELYTEEFFADLDTQGEFIEYDSIDDEEEDSLEVKYEEKTKEDSKFKKTFLVYPNSKTTIFKNSGDEIVRLIITKTDGENKVIINDNIFTNLAVKSMVKIGKDDLYYVANLSEKNDLIYDIKY